ncbi:toll/interleukin-1 receptor domain-containing protein [Inquilinus sp. OTU3971]|uniref:toll/interleukin-1 receptor domain-containing protein n=1 Tax=Inquilinus sp. OTU3971 TaxID=3043855 RepID=UPI00313DAC27
MNSAPKLWLTYAWRDNEEQDVDFVISELRGTGLEVHFDRAQLIVGKRLWQQVDAAIKDPSVSAWAMFVTENSLRSEPCLEEIAYALDRALREKGSNFPLIGIFPAPVDREILPSALATRLYVNLRDPSWKKQIHDGVVGKNTFNVQAPTPFGHKWHTELTLEVWPRAGTWAPFAAMVPEEEHDNFGTIFVSSRNYFPKSMMTMGLFEQRRHDTTAGLMSLKHLQQPVDSINSGFICFKNRRPRVVCFGPLNGELYCMDTSA